METPTPPPDLLSQYLAFRDVVCPGCGYNLRGLAGETCPECGRGLVLGLGTRQPLSVWQRRLIVGFAVLELGTLLTGNIGVIRWLVRSGFSMAAFSGMPGGWWQVQLWATVGLDAVLFVAMGFVVGRLALMRARDDDAFLRCLRGTIVCVALQIGWSIACQVGGMF